MTLGNVCLAAKSRTNALKYNMEFQYRTGFRGNLTLDFHFVDLV